MEEEEHDSDSPKTTSKTFSGKKINMRAEIKPKRPSSAMSRSSSRMQQRAPISIDYDQPSLIDSEHSENTEDEEDDDDAVQTAIIEGAYDPKDFQRLPVSSEVKTLFDYITDYTPQIIQLEYKLVPFVPDYIPAVGDIDGFLKVGRPDSVDDKLGLIVLDEPSMYQSDPAVMHLQLRAATKQSSAKPIIVKKLQNSDKNPRAIDKWIKDISDLHKTKPPPTLEYSRPMPDIDELMQEWPPEFENKLNQIGLPLENLEVDILTYVDIICALFDIPIYESRIESLHVLFTLFSAIKNYKINNNDNNNDETNNIDII